MKSPDIIAALRRHHGVGAQHAMGAEPWAFLVEFKIGAAFQCDSRIDALAVRMGRPSGRPPFERIAYEVKVSRSDLLRELASPAKRHHAESIAHRWVLATPVGLVRPGELPEGAGLVEVTERGVRWRETGTVTTPTAPDHFIAALARRGSRAEEALRRLETA